MNVDSTFNVECCWPILDYMRYIAQRILEVGGSSLSPTAVDALSDGCASLSPRPWMPYRLDALHSLSALKSYLDENVSTLEEAAKFADEYSLTHKSKIGSHDRPYLPKKSGGKPYSAHARDVKERSADINKFSDTKKEVPTGPTCHYCKKPGHVLSECLTLKRKREKEASPNALVKSFTEMPIEFGSMESFCPDDAKKAV